MHIVMREKSFSTIIVENRANIIGFFFEASNYFYI